MPFGILCDEGVEDRKELAHASDYHDFELFTRFLEPLGELPNDGVVVSGGDRRHVQRAADLTATSPDALLALPGARLNVPGGYSYKRGDLLAVEPAQFGQAAQEHGAGDMANSLDASEYLVFVAELFVGLDGLGDQRLELVHLTLDELEGLLDALSGALIGYRFQMTLLLGLHVGQLAPASYEGGEFLVLWGRPGTRLWLDDVGEAGDDGGVDPVGFGEDSSLCLHCLRKSSMSLVSILVSCARHLKAQIKSAQNAIAIRAR